MEKRQANVDFSPPMRVFYLGFQKRGSFLHARLSVQQCGVNWIELAGCLINLGNDQVAPYKRAWTYTIVL